MLTQVSLGSHKEDVKFLTVLNEPRFPNERRERAPTKHVCLASISTGPVRPRAQDCGTLDAAGGSDSFETCFMVIPPKPTRRWIRPVPA
jgi:hypothetical protein